MGKLFMVLLALGFLTMSSNPVFAAPAKVEQAPAAVVTKKQNNKMQEMVSKKKMELEGTVWAIDIKPMSGKGKAEKDTLNFADDKISSKNMEGRGFTATNYSMRILEDDETYTWETMQVSEKDGTAFWRGDIGSDGIMRGVMTIRDKKNRTSDYNFYSLNETKAAPVSAPVPVAVEPAAEAVVE
jgi:hypothetical protein